MTDREIGVVEDFHRLFYRQGAMAYAEGEAKTGLTATYQGYLVQKNPLDLWVYQEIIWEKSPDMIIEFGTASGGTTLFMANVLDGLGEGEIFSVDIDNRLGMVPPHRRITYIVGDSLEAYDTIVGEIARRAEIGRQEVMVILDDDHSYEHVKKELEVYSKLVTVGQYLIVEDTNVDWPMCMGDGPGRAVHEFMQNNEEFVVDRKREKFLMTWNPGGYLKRVK